MPSEPDLIEVHHDLLTLLKEIHTICTRNDIKYSLHAGTLLGAVREKGFIPWDNDGDISMMRCEFNKLCSLIEKADFGPDVSVITDCRIPRFVLQREGIITAFVDIFIYDYITENKMGIKVKFWTNMFLRAFIEDGVNLKAAKMRNLYKPWTYRLFGFFQSVGKLLPAELALKMFTGVNVHFLNGRHKFIFRSNDGYPGLHLVLPAEVMEKFELMHFEDTSLFVSSRWADILSSSYGDDFMTPKRLPDIHMLAHDEMKKGLASDPGR